MIARLLPHANVRTDPAFVLFCILLLVFPWPLGGNRDWLWPWFTVGFVSCSLLLSLRPASFCIRSRVMLLALALWCTWILAQLLADLLGFTGTLDRYLTRNELLKTFTWLGIVHCTLVFAQSKRQLHIILVVLVAGGMANAMLGLWQVVIWEELSARGSYASPNHFAGYLLLCSGAALSLSGSGTRWSRFACYSALLLFAVLILLSDSRGAALAGAIAGVGLVALPGKGGHPLKQRILKMALVALVASVVMLVIFKQQADNPEVSANARWQVYKTTLAMISDRPLTGFGAGTYAMAFPAYRDAASPGRVTHAESDYLELLAELGIIGAGAPLLLLLAGLGRQPRYLRAGDQHLATVTRGSLFATLALLIHGLVDFNLQIPANAAVFLVLLAVPTALAQEP